MFQKRYGKPGSSPATLLPHLVNGVGRKPAIQIIEYYKGHLNEREITDLDAFTQLDHSQCVTWINIDGLGDVEVLKRLGEQFDLHPLALEDVLNTGQRPKIEQYPGHLFLIAQMVYHDKAKMICGEQVSIFFGKNFLITIQEEGEYDVFEPIRERIRSGRGTIRENGADYLAYALLDSLIDHYYPVLDELGGAIEELEDELLEITTGLMELYHSSVGLRTNEVMRVLTVITSIFIPLTFIVGLYGMNFSPQSLTGKNLPLNMPELYHPYGYIGIIIVMMMIAIIQLVIFKKIKWL